MGKERRQGKWHPRVLTSTGLQHWKGRRLLKESPGPRFVHMQNGEALPSITAPSDRCENKMKARQESAFNVSILVGR